MVNNRSINANNSGSKTDKTKSEQNETNMKQQHKGNKVALSKKQRNGQGTNSNIAGETKTKSSSKVIHNSTGSTKSQKPSSTIIFTNSHTINKKGFHTHHLDLQKSFRTSHRITGSSYAQTVGKDSAPVYSNKYATQSDSDRYNSKSNDNTVTSKESRNSEPSQTVASDSLSIAPSATCVKCSSSSSNPGIMNAFNLIGPIIFNNKLYRKSKSYAGGSRATGTFVEKLQTGNSSKQPYRRSSFDRNFAERNKDFVPIVPPARPVLSSSNIAAVIADTEKLTIFELTGKGRTLYPIMQCGTLEAPDSSYHQQRSHRMDVFQIDDGFHSDGGTDTPPPSPSSGSSIASTSDHGSLESVDTGGAQRLAVLSFEQVRKLNDVMDETVAIHGRGNFPTLEVKLKDLVNLVRRKLEADVGSGGAGVIVKDIRLNGGAASHVLASEDQPYNDLDLIYAIELSSSRHFDRVKTAVLNTLLDLLPEGVSKRRIMPCALKEAYVGKMVKVNNNNDGDRWSLISLGNSPGHKNVELKFVDTMRRQFEFSVDSFQIVLDSLLLFYDCATLPISENFYPTVVGESVYGDFQEALYHLQKKLISTRQPEEIRGGGLLKYCNLLVRNYKPVDPQRIKTQERYMCSRFFIDFPDINIQTVKLEAYLRNHFWGIDEEPLQYQYLMHLREVVEMSTVCLMAHERRQTLLLIQSLATQVLYREQQKHQQAQAEEQYHQQQKLHHQQQQKQVAEMKPQSVGVVSVQQQPQQIYLHQQTQQQHQPQSMTTSTALCCPLPSTTTIVDSKQQQQQQQSVTTSSVPQTIHIQAGPPGLIYANGVYYAPVIPTTICTCNSTWLST